jgi:uncharacterized protein
MAERFRTASEGADDLVLAAATAAPPDGVRSVAGAAAAVGERGRSPGESSEQHALLRSILLHLGPGAALTAFIVLTGPTVRGWGFPTIFALFLGVALVIVPLELGYLVAQARRRTGRWSPLAVVAYRERLRMRSYVLWTLGLALWFSVVLAVSVSLLDEPIAERVFGWLPASILEFATFEDDATHAT